MASELPDGDGDRLREPPELRLVDAHTEIEADAVENADADVVRDSSALRVATDETDVDPLSERGGLGDTVVDGCVLSDKVAVGDRVFCTESVDDGDPETRALELPLRLKLALELKGALFVAENETDPVDDFSDDALALVLGDEEGAAAFENVAHTVNERVPRDDAVWVAVALLAALRLRVPTTVGEKESVTRDDGVCDRETMLVGVFPIVGRIVKVELGHVDEDTDNRGELDADVVAVDEGEREGLPETRVETDTLVDPVDDVESDARADTSALKLPVPLGVTPDDGVIVGVPETAAVDETRTGTVCVPVNTGETDADSDGECVADADMDGDRDDDGEPVDRGDCVDDLVARELPDALDDALTRPLLVEVRDAVDDVVAQKLVVTDTV